jgi:hypothetical protein
MFTAGNEGDGLAAKEKVVRILRMQADGIGVEGLQQESKQQNQASEHSDSAGAPGEQLACRGFSRALAICRPGHIGDDEEQQQYQWHKCHGASFAR